MDLGIGEATKGQGVKPKRIVGGSSPRQSFRPIAWRRIHTYLVVYIDEMINVMALVVSNSVWYCIGMRLG